MAEIFCTEPDAAAGAEKGPGALGSSECDVLRVSPQRARLDAPGPAARLLACCLGPGACWFCMS